MPVCRIALLLAGCITSAHAARLWATSSLSGNNGLLVLDTADPGSVSTYFVSLDESAPLGVGLAGTDLWVYDTINNVLRRVQSDGTAVSEINLGLTGTVEGDLTFTDANTGYIVSADGVGVARLIRFQLDTGNSTVVNGNLPMLMGLTLGPDGFLYGLGKGGPADANGVLPDLGLYRIDPVTGDVLGQPTFNSVMTCFDDFGTPQPCTVGSLTFGEGTFFAVASAIGAFPNLYTIDPTSGIVTNLGVTSIREISGLAFETPEPSTLILVGCGLSALFLRRQRR